MADLHTYPPLSQLQAPDLFGPRPQNTHMVTKDHTKPPTHTPHPG
jgi:hypothetical protein